MTANEAIVRDFIAAWSRLNADELVEFFTPDGTYHNMMAKPVSGHDDLRRFIGGFEGAGDRGAVTPMKRSSLAR
jgi:limonene-1,2-epoxide hydrolase